MRIRKIKNDFVLNKEEMMNFFNRKTQKKIIMVIAIILVLVMVATMVSAIVGF